MQNARWGGGDEEAMTTAHAMDKEVLNLTRGSVAECGWVEGKMESRGV